MTNKQRTILTFARDHGRTITLEQSIELIGKYYYANERKHVGVVLSRLVKSGHLRREKPGTFWLVRMDRQTQNEAAGKGQPSLFQE